MLPITTVPPDPPTYQTTELCAQAALRAALAAALAAHEAGHEYGGVLLSDGAVCTYTVPVTIHDAYHVAYRARFSPPWRLVGIYHTHPAESVPVFSENDYATAKALHVPSWIVATFTGRIASMTGT